ncbi:MAG TPA: MFS transporter [Candidatus Limnocylindrales bacterium]|nr:MFS transporter [Candidatus Limnocylindrales bacterium]
MASDSSKSNPIMSGSTENTSWVKSVLPYSIATGPVGTLVVLLILNLHGTVLDVSFAVTLFNAVSIPAAIFWGFATDRARRRKVLIVASYVATAMVLFLFLFAESLYLVTLLYALFSFVTTALTTPLNLLVMETSPKQKWATAFAWFSMVTSIGQTAGLILGTIWSSLFLLRYLVIPLGILSMASAGMSVVMIKEPQIVFERQIIIHNKHSFFERLQRIPIIFYRMPRLSDFKRMFRSLRYELTRSVPVLYFSIFMFYVASGLFNTSVIASMEAKQISNLPIFFVVTVVNIAQILSFKYAGSYVEKNTLVNSSISGLTLRGVSYALLGVSFYFVSGFWYALPTLVFYSLAGGLAFSIYYTASNTMVFNTLGDKSGGSTLGVYSALVGIASMAGSLVSGFTSFYLGYGITFLLASLCLAVSVGLVLLLRGT